MHGGDLVARELQRQGVRFLFTLCGGHISPILVGAKRLGIRIVDVRDEVTAAFAADARLALDRSPRSRGGDRRTRGHQHGHRGDERALAQSPFVLLGGATATLLRGRGSLQDIDQLALMKPQVKWLGEPRECAR